MSTPSSPHWDFRRIATVTPDPQRGFTHVALEQGIADAPFETPARMPSVFVLRRQASLFGYNAQPWAALPVTQRIGDVDPNTGEVAPGVYSGREWSWNNAQFSAAADRINLDAVYSQITRGSWIVLAEAGTGTKPPAQLYNVTGTADTNAADFGLTGRVTQLGVAGNHIEWFSPANAAVYAQSEQLLLAERPILEPLDLGTIELAGYAPGLAPDRAIIVAGQRVRVVAPAGSKLQATAADGSVRPLVPDEQLIVLGLSAKAANGMRVYTLRTADGFAGAVIASEATLPWAPAAASDPVVADAATIAGVRISDDAQRSIVDLAAALTHFYDRTTVTIYA
ncbi:MAG TPA: hypothetical protein VFX03_14655, partial [Thermomicrobiales bacterium]|nr:hypothetical protein [Thermomicrobiales bacterium]